MISVINLIDSVISIYIWLIVISAILSWLIVFNVINTHNQFISMARDLLHRLTEPVLKPIRRFLPDLGGVDVSPVVLILLLIFVRSLMYEIFEKVY